MLAEVAARTFPLACPPTLDDASIAAFVTDSLNPARFAAYLADPARVLLLAEEELGGAARAVGYTMLVHDSAAPGETDPAGEPDEPGGPPSTAELSKCYIDAAYQGTGLADVLLTATLDVARASGPDRVWLGTNRVNGRARRFYARHGFTVVGARQFRVGDVLEDDVVMALVFASTARTVAE
ncbi:GNAT family N-acetyltransferase [Georgenia wangjunii]|uniref:GNAT family N-acetyltransferase n=1 Tax=Georgenia wangjunii TaxID=3117730 RepID=UPI002F262CC6